MAHEVLISMQLNELWTKFFIAMFIDSSFTSLQFGNKTAWFQNDSTACAFCAGEIPATAGKMFFMKQMSASPLP